jgi:tetratricopeptide (TPR) repeat protein
VDEAAPLLVLRAELQAKKNQPDRARVDAAAAFKIIAEKDPGQLGAWFEAMGRVFPKTADMLAFLQGLQKAVPGTEWPAFFYAKAALAEKDLRTQALDDLARLGASSANPAVKVMVCRERGRALHADRRYAEAAAEMRQGLELAKDDLEFNNNLAYLLAKQLSKPEEAAPFAQKAAEINPESPSVLDTLAVVHAMTGKLDTAEKTLDRAVRMAQLPSDQATLWVHMADVRLQRKDRPGALKALDEAREAIKRIDASQPEVVAAVTKELDEVAAKAGAR